MGSMAYFIAGEVQRAREDNAPPNAVYERTLQPGVPRSHVWVTTDDIIRPGARRALGLDPEEAPNA